MDLFLCSIKLYDNKCIRTKVIVSRSFFLDARTIPFAKLLYHVTILKNMWLKLRKGLFYCILAMFQLYDMNMLE